MAEQEYPMPKDFLVEMLEKEDEKFFMECYEVHKEYEIKAGRQPEMIEAYKKWFYRERTAEEIKQAEEEQDKLDTYLRHNGSIGARARTKPKLTLFAKLQKFTHKLFS
jgi:hypothetical protein